MVLIIKMFSCKLPEMYYKYFQCVRVIVFFCRTMSKEASSSSAKQVDFTQQWSFADIAFVVEGKRLWANRAILAMWSPVFEAMFGSDFKEKNLSEIELPGKKFDSMLELLAVTHPPNREITGKSVQESCLSSLLPNLMGSLNYNSSKICKQMYSPP